MKVAFITLHRVFNYGSVLQAYATQKVIESVGHEPIVIDYIPKAWQLKSLLWQVHNPKGFVKDSVYRLMRAASVVIKTKKFWGFLKKNLNMTKTYRSFEELCVKPPEADVYCAGSDQMWNIKYSGIDEAFYLRFAQSTARKIAFSTSIGMTGFSNDESGIIKDYVSDFDALSFREESACGLMKSLGFDSEVIIDPTLQLTKEEWRVMASDRLIKENYLVLMLLYNEDNNATKIAREIADKKGLKLVKISWELTKPEGVDILMTHRSPEEFLSLFYNADYVVTNSFHGLAFTINFNKPFIAIKRNEYNTRLENLLSVTNLTDRMVTDNIDRFDIDMPINYDFVNDVLNEERKKAKEFLLENIK